MEGRSAHARRRMFGAAVAIAAAGALVAGCTNTGGGGGGGMIPWRTTTTMAPGGGMDHGDGGMDHGGGGGGGGDGHDGHGGGPRLDHPPTQAQKDWAYGIIRTTADALRGMTKQRAIAQGYNDIGDGQHFTHPRFRHDGKEFAPNAIESLVFNRLTGQIQAAMYNMEPSTTVANVKDYAGNWIVWHGHDTLCWQSGVEGSPGYTRLAPCGVGVKHPTVLMVHVWITDTNYAVQCGAFATITGLGEGSCLPELRPSRILAGQRPL
jgi:hypothetical protein